MLDEDPAKREAWSTESSALIYTTGKSSAFNNLYYWYLKTTYHLNIQKQKKNENNNVQFIIRKKYKVRLNSRLQTKGADRPSDNLIRKKIEMKVQ